MRLIVELNKAKVYVDGSYAGKVDDFDGIFQSLKLPRGRHDIAIKLDGYQTHRFRIYATPSHTMKIRLEMTKGSGDVFEDLTKDLEDVAEAQPAREIETGEGDDRTVTLPNVSRTAMLSSLSTNAEKAANSVWGASNALVFEGARRTILRLPSPPPMSPPQTTRSPCPRRRGCCRSPYSWPQRMTQRIPQVQKKP